ncbi:MAG: DNA-binding protein [Planctomycetota bacterium]|jgi:hypothetical protein
MMTEIKWTEQIANPEYITAQEAARLTGYRADYIRKLCREMVLEGKQWGNRWQVEKKVLLDYARRRGRHVLEN